MRNLVKLLNIARKEENFEVTQKNILNMFRRENFRPLRSAIDVYTSNEDDTIKARLKQIYSIC